MTLGFKLPPLASIGGFKFIMPINAFMSYGAPTLAAGTQSSTQRTETCTEGFRTVFFIANKIFHFSCDAVSNGNNKDTGFTVV